MLREYAGERLGRRARTPHNKRMRYAAVFVDFENIYQALAHDPEDPEPIDDSTVDEGALDDAVELLSHLKVRLREKYNCVMAIGRSYADFDRLGGDAQSQLQLLAFEPRFTLSTKKKSSSDILLSIDATEMMLTRQELDMFVIVGGDRDYLPVVRRIREHMKRVVLVGFKGSASSDLKQVVGEENFIAAEYLLPEAEPSNGGGERRSYESYHRAEEREPRPPRPEVVESLVETPPATEEDLRQCLEELLSAYYQYGERKVWLTPFLRMLNDRFPHLDNRGRKRLVEDLQAKSAISIEKIEGDPYPYSVIEINWEDDWVRGMDEARGNT